MRVLKQLFVILAGYTALALFFIRGIINAPGILSGGDWGLPETLSQMNRFFQSGFYTWSDREILGTEQFFNNSLPFQLVVGLLAKLGITGDIYTKWLLIAAFVFPATTMYVLCRFLGISKRTSFFSGYLYMTLPFFLNYAAMGWLFVLIAMGILPIALVFFIKSAKEQRIFYAVITGVLYSIAMIQSQTLIWYPLVFLSFVPFLVSDKKSLLAYIKSFFITSVVFIFLSAYFAMPIFFSGAGEILNTNLGLSTISLGTWVRLSPLNIIRGWGSLFNEPYESSTINGLAPLSFLIPVVAYSSLLIRKKSRLTISLLLLSLVPITLFFLGSKFIVMLPLSDVIRDIARFSVISSFAYIILVSLVLHFMIGHKKKSLRLGGILVCIMLVAGTYPFWVGDLYSSQRLQYDVRLRTYSSPPEYGIVEDILQKDSTDTKVLYLPIAGELSMTDDRRFYGTYRGIRDIYASFGVKQGMIGLSDRLKGAGADLVYEIDKQVNIPKSKNLAPLLTLADIKYIVVRKNMTHPALASYWTGKEITDQFRLNRSLDFVGEWDKIALLRNTTYLPHIYIPNTIIISKKKVATLPEIVTKWDYNIRSVIYFTRQNTEARISENGLYDNQNPLQIQTPTVEYKKINPTKYLVVIHNVSGKFPLVFSELFNDQWKLYLKKITSIPISFNTEAANYGTFQNDSILSGKINETWGIKPLSEESHLIANSYANSWIINPQIICSQASLCKKNSDGSYDMEAIIEFSPQKLFYIGAMISIATLFLSILFIIVSVIISSVYDKQK